MDYSLKERKKKNTYNVSEKVYHIFLSKIMFNLVAMI